jgi:hypothetical protein
MSDVAPVAPPPQEIRGFPVWIKLSAAVVVVLVLVSAVRMVPVFREATMLERAHRHLSEQKFAEAAAELAPIAARYPESTDLQLDVAEAQLRSENYPAAAEALVKIEGREVSKEQEERANGLAAELNSIAEKLEKKEKAK